MSYIVCPDFKVGIVSCAIKQMREVYVYPK
jgi:hypothetical protein